jgi:glycosyltransferase involved in cell wall biosynthesis
LKVSVIIPVYNERALILEIIRRALAAPLPGGFSREVVVVDDGSDDGTAQLVRSAPLPAEVILHSCAQNRGKGAAVRAGLQIATGEIFLIQDGDLEYDPVENYFNLIEPFLDSSTQIVYGSRFIRTHFPEGMATPNWIANKVLTHTTRALFSCSITDEATGYKVFRREVIASFDLTSDGFEFCPEFTAKSLRSGYSITEVPINYRGRNLLQGKKIRAHHAITALATLIRLRIQPPRRKGR